MHHEAIHDEGCVRAQGRKRRQQHQVRFSVRACTLIINDQYFPPTFTIIRIPWLTWDLFSFLASREKKIKIKIKINDFRLLYHDAWIGEDDTPESLHMEDNGQDFQKSLFSAHIIHLPTF